MKRTIAALLAVALFAGCSTAYLTGRVPFPRSSMVAEYKLDDLRAKVIEQDEFRLHPPATNIFAFKRFPSPKEFERLRSEFQDGDVIVEFKDDDWNVGIDHMSSGPERAFCLVRSGNRIRTVKIWPTDQER